MKTFHDMTVFNKYTASGAEAYQRTQIEGVNWENRKASNVLRTGGTIAADQAVVYIPFARDADYLDPKAWNALSSKTGKWTLAVGDYIVKGLVTDTIGASFTITALKAKYDDVLQVTSVDKMDMGSLALRHWKVSAK
jgi:hypothetical protein